VTNFLQLSAIQYWDFVLKTEQMLENEKTIHTVRIVIVLYRLRNVLTTEHENGTHIGRNRAAVF
jgi:hypothetical protein